MARRTTRLSRTRSRLRPSSLKRKGRALVGRARKMANARKRQASRAANRVVRQPARKAARTVKRTVNYMIDSLRPD